MKQQWIFLPQSKLATFQEIKSEIRSNLTAAAAAAAAAAALHISSMHRVLEAALLIFLPCDAFTVVQLARWLFPSSSLIEE